MKLLKRIIQKYKGRLRGWKLVYTLNNMFNLEAVHHNKTMYKKFGLDKSIFAPVGRHDFDGTGEPPWLDQEGSKEQLTSDPKFLTFDANSQRELIRFVEEGYMIFRGFYSEKIIDEANAEIDRLRSEHKIDFNYGGRKIMNAHEESDLLRESFFNNSNLISLFEFIFRKKMIPFQTINFLYGSEQKAHSDSIHMSTFPEGFMIASWTALEDIDKDQGPVFYYPGSHRLPYVSCQDFASGNTKWTIGENSYKKYEEYIEALIDQKGLVAKNFTAKKGDVLVWHANLLHGGSYVKDVNSSRKSMVAHYYTDEVICYHEISQRVAHLRHDIT